MDFLSAAALVIFIAYVVIRGTRNYLLKKRHEKKEQEAIANKLPPEKIQAMRVRHAFDRREDTRGVKLLSGEEPDT